MIDIKKAGEDAIPVIRNLANITWPVTYGDILSPEQLDYMMELIYSKTSLQKQMQKGDTFVIAYDADEPVAFAAYSPRENNKDIYKLHKLYILPNQQGKGLGKLLINYIKDDIQPSSTLQLNVNRHNKALYFYEKLGFKIIAEEDIDIGDGFYMNDYVMEVKF
ncbi:MAG: GNAT family N-acetyltransferase [Ferruginibacter sp.]